MLLGEIAARGRALWRALTGGRQLDIDMDDEMRFHMEQHAERLIHAQGLAPDEARRQAAIAFGGVEKFKEEGRDIRGVQWIDAMSLDARLGARMLVKHRALTLIGSFAIAVAIGVGATSFEFITEVLYPTFPIADGDRLVSIQYQTDNLGNPERRVLRDFLDWRHLSSIEHVGAFHTIERNLVSGAAVPEPISIAEISPSAFTVAQTPPLLGRYLLPDDERDGAPNVMVIGYSAWQSRFAADPGIVGRDVNLEGDTYTVVGVMPEGFAFPISHRYWIPLRANAARQERLDGPLLYVFGRLAPGVSIEAAQGELTAYGERQAAASPALYERLRPVVLPYTREHVEIDNPLMAWLLWIFQLLISALVVVVGVNVAVLTYAQTMARSTEISVRTALGASRRRILTQLFIEATALSGLGAIAGLLLADIALAQIMSLVTAVEGVPFWLDLQLSPSTVMYGLAMALFAAFIVGVLPGLKVTGGQMLVHLRELSGGTKVRLGRTWTFLIVAQVAAAVTVLPLAVYIVWQVMQTEVADAGFAVDRYFVGEVAVRDESRLRLQQQEFMERLKRVSGVAGVTFSASIPGDVGAFRRVEFDRSTSAAGALAEDAERRSAGIMRVDVNMFSTYRVPVIAGRDFTSADADQRVVIVDRAFVDLFMGSRPVLGQRFRYTRALGLVGEDRPGDWMEIVGVVETFPRFPLEPGTEPQPTVYQPVGVGTVNPVVLSVQFGSGVPADFVGRFRHAGAETDPALQLRSTMPLSEAYDRHHAVGRLIAWGLALATASVLLLSAAGIYALMSFTVAQRTREIGIRAALGAHPLQLLATVFGGVMRQLALGIAVGSLASAALLANTSLRFAEAGILLAAVAGILVMVGLVAAAGPARQSLRMQTTEALRA